MQFAVKAAFLCTGLVLLLTPPTASQEQCSLPTDQDVRNVADEIFQSSTSDGVAPSVQELLHKHFTCLATVALDMFAYATVIANFTHTGSSDSTVQQFQLRCVDGAWEKSTFSSFKNPENLPAMPCDIETQIQCSLCEQLDPTLENYDPDSHCLCE